MVDRTGNGIEDGTVGEDAGGSRKAGGDGKGVEKVAVQGVSRQSESLIEQVHLRSSDRNAIPSDIFAR